MTLYDVLGNFFSAEKVGQEGEGDLGDHKRGRYTCHESKEHA